MFAVVEVGSSQFKVTEGDTIEVNQLETEKDKAITLDKVLMFVNDSDIRIGQPYLKGIKITANVVKHYRGKKVVAFKFRRRKHYSKKTGHRRDLTALSITKIQA